MEDFSMLGDIVRYNFFALDEADKETYSLDYAVVLDIDEAKDAIILYRTYTWIYGDKE